MAAPPEPLDPDQRRRPAAGRQVAHAHSAPSVRRGDRTAAGAASHVVRRFQGQLELAIMLIDGNQPETVETEDHRPQVPRASSIRAHLGPPSDVSKHHEE